MPSVLDIGRRTRWAPGPSAKINWNHPLAAGLRGFAIPVGGTYIELVNQRQVSDTSSTTSCTSSIYGQAVTLASGVSARSRFASAANNPVGSTSVTLMTIGRANGGADSIRGGIWGSGTAEQCVLIGWANSTGDMTYAANDGVPRIVGGTTGLAADRQWHVACLVASGAPISVSAYFDGVRVGSGASGSSGLNANPSNGKFGIGTSEIGTWAGDMAAQGIWGRALSDAEIASLYADPFQMLDDQPLRKYVLFGALSASGPSLLPIRRRQTLISTKG